MISFILPNYNHAKYLPRAIEAVLSQEGADFELLIIDDGSTDNSLEIISYYSDPRIKVFTTPRNRGLVYTLNKGLLVARGEYLSLGAADDFILPGFFRKSLVLLEQYPQAAFCTTRFIYFNEKGFFEQSYPNFPPQSYFSPSELASLMRNQLFWICTHGCIFRKKALFDSGLINGQLDALGDWFFTLSVGLRGGICYIPEGMTCFRASEQSYSRRNPVQETYDKLFELLESSEHEDILSLFLRSGAFFQLRPPILTDLLQRPRYWRYFLPTLMRKVKRHYFRQRFCPFHQKTINAVLC